MEEYNRKENENTSDTSTCCFCFHMHLTHFCFLQHGGWTRRKHRRSRDETNLKHPGNILLCNLELNAYCALRNDITESNASEAVLLSSLSLPVFRKEELGGLLRMIHDFASMLRILTLVLSKPQEKYSIQSHSNETGSGGF